MADVRSLLKNERASRRIQHKYASYTPTGTLLCVVCHLQLKSESLWDGHLRSTGHVMRVQKAHEAQESESQEPQPGATPVAENNNKKKRKAESEGEDTIRKRTRAANGLPEDFFDQGEKPLDLSSSNPLNEIRIPSRPATPLKLSPSEPIVPAIPKPVEAVDESEWAAFEAEIAAAEVPEVDDAVVISAKPMTAAELAAQSVEESNRQRKERAEAEIEGDKEDAARKMEDELEEMEGLEERVRKLRERREALRKKESMILIPKTEEVKMDIEEDDDDDEEDEDDWDGFRMKG